MNKKLTSKTQHLSPAQQESTKVFAKSITIEPENRELLLKKGTIHAVFKIRESNEFDSALVSKVIYDVLHDAYYKSESVSPIQSLEKAITDVRDNVSKLSNESIGAAGGDLKFDIVASVLWGNVFYIVKYGSGQAFMVRGTEITNINTMSEGNFAAASSLVKDDDVVILCTDEFAQAYPPKRLLETQLGEKDLGIGQACILMKFQVDASLSEEEVVNFGVDVKEEKKSKKKKIAMPAIFKRRERFEPNTQPSEPQLQTLVSPITEAPKIKIKRTLRPKMHIPIKVFIPIIGVLLVASILWTIRARKNEDSNVDLEAPVLVADDNTNTLPPEMPSTEGLAETKPSEIAGFNNTIVVVDTTSGKIYTSDVEDIKFDVLTNEYAGIKSVQNFDGKLAFVDSEGSKIYNLSTDELDETYTASDITKSSYYLDFIYSLEGDKIIKYSKDGDALSGTTWAQSADFENAKDLEVAFSIYILTKDDTLVSYTGGEKDTDFEVTGLEKNFSGATQIVTSLDYDNVYIADSGNKRVVVLDKDGKFITEYSDPAWTSINSIGINTAEDTLFVLSGNRVYKIDL